MEQWVVFRNKETGQELAAFTIRGTFPGETEATRDLLAAEHGLPPEQITVTIEDQGKKTIICCVQAVRTTADKKEKQANRQGRRLKRKEGA